MRWHSGPEGSYETRKAQLARTAQHSRDTTVTHSTREDPGVSGGVDLCYTVSSAMVTGWGYNMPTPVTTRPYMSGTMYDENTSRTTMKPYMKIPMHSCQHATRRGTRQGTHRR